MKPKEKTRPICPPAQSGKSGWVGDRNPIEGVREPQGERERKVKHFSLGPPQGIPKGAALAAPLVTFPATGKSPGCRAGGRQVGAGAASPAKTPGARGGAPAWWVQGLPAPHKLPGYGAQRPPYGGRGGAAPPLRGVGAKSHDLLPRGSAPRIGPQRPSRKGAKRKTPPSLEAPFFCGKQVISSCQIHVPANATMVCQQF